jgi:methionyl-tRNA formyltransferase
MRLGVAATPEVAIPTLEWLHSSKHTIELIITQPDKPAGRGRVLTQSPVADWAEQHKIEVVKPASSTELNGVIDNLDCVITIGYGVLLPQAVLDLPRHGFLNLHFSLLPQYRGAAPAQYALLHGVEKTGVTVFQLDKGMDTGPILSQIEVGIDPQWRSFELLKVLAERGVEAVDQALEMIAQEKSPTPQTGTPSFAPKISKQDALIDFTKDSVTVVNAIRAYTYEPGAWSLWNSEPFKVSAAISAQAHSLSPSTIAVINNCVFVGCGNGTTIELLRVVPAGKKEMAAIDWARGARLNGGESFG